MNVEIIASGVGGITESDVRLAATSDSVIVAFNVRLGRGLGDLAEKSGVPIYRRVPAVGTHPSFIGGLADRVRAILAEPQVAVCHGATAMPCGAQHLGCPLVSRAIAGGL